MHGVPCLCGTTFHLAGILCCGSGGTRSVKLRSCLSAAERFGHTGGPGAGAFAVDTLMVWLSETVSTSCATAKEQCASTAAPRAGLRHPHR